MKTSFIKKITALLLAISVSVLGSAMVSASDVSQEKFEMSVSNNAGNNGAYQYTIATKEQTHLPTTKYSRSSDPRTSPQKLPKNFQSDGDSRTVTYPDTRFKVTNTTGRYSNTALLEVRFGSNTTFATGWVIGHTT